MDKLTKAFIIAASSVVVLAGGVYLKTSLYDPVLIHFNCVYQLAVRYEREHGISIKDSDPNFKTQISRRLGRYCNHFGDDFNYIWANWGRMKHLTGEEYNLDEL